MTGPEPARRLFFALWPDARVLARAVDAVATLVPRGAGRPLRADQLHLTLEFLGNVLDRVEYWRRPQVLSLTASVLPGPVGTLVDSRTDPDGSRYSRLAAWPLGR
jgi:2'-5' RNA ligase